MNVNARMRTEIDLNESEIDLNECEHFLKANWDRSEIDPTSWINLSVNGSYYTLRFFLTIVNLMDVIHWQQFKGRFCNTYKRIMNKNCVSYT